MIFATESYKAARDEQLAQLRADLEARIAEKDLDIKRLRAELQARGVRMEAPIVEPKPAPVWSSTVDPNAPLDWQGELSKMLQEEDDGIRERGRIQEHQPSADDGAQAVNGA